MTEKVFSFGGGVQSTAALVLAARGEIDYRTFLFANVGDDSEDPRTLEYVRGISMPFAEKSGIRLIELKRIKRDGSEETLWGRLTKSGSRSIPIPVRMSHNGAPGTRNCTADFKIRVIAKWHRENGASKKSPAIVGIGISLDEAHRMRSDALVPYQVLEYPLIDLRLRRHDCVEIIKNAGLPVPPKSACFFCPFHSLSSWVKLREERPDLYKSSCDLESLLNRRREELGRDRVYLTRYGIPLYDVVEDAASQESFDFDGPDACETGYCWT